MVTILLQLIAANTFQQCHARNFFWGCKHAQCLARYKHSAALGNYFICNCNKSF